MEFEARLRDCYPDVVRFARGLTGDPDEGDDLLQDALLKAWQGYGRLRDPSRFRFWLLRIIGNVHRSRLRRRRWRNLFGLEAGRDIPAEQQLGYEDRTWVRQALHRLPREQQEALILHEVVGLSVDETSQVQGVTPSAVKSRLARGRRGLRERLTRSESPANRPTDLTAPVEPKAAILTKE